MVVEITKKATAALTSDFSNANLVGVVFFIKGLEWRHALSQFEERPYVPCGLV